MRLTLPCVSNCTDKHNEMKTTELEKLETLLIRNRLMSKMKRNGHSFKEEIKFETNPASLSIRLVIGGEDKGLIGYKYIYEGDCVFKKAEELYKNILLAYDDCRYGSVPRDLE